MLDCIGFMKLAWVMQLLLVSSSVQPDLIEATRDDNARQVWAIVSAGANVDQADDTGRTALMLAAVNGNLEIVDLLLGAGADVTLEDAQGLDALTLARASGHDAIAARLERAGATPSPEARLHRAIEAGELDTVTQLIGTGVDVDALDTDDYQTPLMAAVTHRRMEILLRLVEAGADPSREGTGIETTGENAISTAARRKSPWALRVLAEAGGGTDELDRALFLACDVPAIVSVAIQAGADANARDARGRTPLMCAAERGNGEAITILLGAGAERDAVDPEGRTARSIAIRAGHREAQARLAR